MKKRFKSKRKIKTKYKKIIIITITLILTIIILNYLSNLKIIKQDVIKTLTYSNNLKETNIKQEIIDITTQIIKVDVNKPTTILKNIMYYETPNIKKNYYAIENEKTPLIYIYNTHEKEEYQQINGQQQTVKNASYYLKEKLEELKIPTIVEEKSIKETIEENNLSYTQSYKASRINLEKIKNEIPSIKIFIDLHRDALPKKLSTVTIDDKNYAKILFVIGKEHDNYQKNLEFTNSLNNIIEKKYPTLTKGILQKEGPGVNGIYNQDLKENIILMEVGAQENTIDEVTNTLDIISEIIREKINEKEK